MKENLETALNGMRKWYFKRDEIMFQNYAQGFNDTYNKAKHLYQTKDDEKFMSRVLGEYQTILNKGRVVFPNLKIDMKDG